QVLALAPLDLLGVVGLVGGVLGGVGRQVHRRGGAGLLEGGTVLLRGGIGRAAPVARRRRVIPRLGALGASRQEQHRDRRRGGQAGEGASSAGRRRHAGSLSRGRVRGARPS